MMLRAVGAFRSVNLKKSSKFDSLKFDLMAVILAGWVYRCLLLFDPGNVNNGRLYQYDKLVCSIGD